ncbi:MAG: YraN family protein, partial [Ilumatobacteraceae bacterium]
MGHVPQEPFRSEGENPQLQGRQRRGTSARGRVRPRSGLNHNRDLGSRGEQLVVDWYRRRGHDIVDRNWRCRGGEIDIVATQANVLVFCEVKTRATDRFGSPAHAVTLDKQRRLRRLAVAWMSAHGFR